ncbi:MAG: hypothetical protein ACRDP8_03255 [Actinopolymorphaceae bacterium]
MVRRAGWDAFFTYIGKLRKEVDECKLAVASGATTLQAIHDQLDTQQWQMFGVAVANLVVLIIMEITGWAWPPSKPAMKVAMEVVGVVFSIGVASYLALILGTLYKLYEQVKTLVGASFVTEKESSDAGNGVDFKEISLGDSEIAQMIQNA